MREGKSPLKMLIEIILPERFPHPDSVDGESHMITDQGGRNRPRKKS